MKHEHAHPVRKLAVVLTNSSLRIICSRLTIERAEWTYCNLASVVNSPLHPFNTFFKRCPHPALQEVVTDFIRSKRRPEFRPDVQRLGATTRPTCLRWCLISRPQRKPKSRTLLENNDAIASAATACVRGCLRAATSGRKWRRQGSCRTDMCHLPRGAQPQRPHDCLDAVDLQ